MHHWVYQFLGFMLFVWSGCIAQTITNLWTDGEEGGDITFIWNVDIPNNWELNVFEAFAKTKSKPETKFLTGNPLSSSITNSFLKPRLTNHAKTGGQKGSKFEIEVTLKNLTMLDDGMLIISEANIRQDVTEKDRSTKVLRVYEKGKTPKNDEGSNTGVIVGAVFGAIAFIVLIAVVIFLYLRWKKDQSKTPNSERMSALDKGHADEGSHYASTEAAVPQQKREQVIYAPLGAGGGRVGPRSEPEKSNYAEAKVDEQGYPVGPPPPDKPERGVERDNGDDEEGFTSGIVV